MEYDDVDPFDEWAESVCDDLCKDKNCESGHIAFGSCQVAMALRGARSRGIKDAAHKVAIHAEGQQVDGNNINAKTVISDLFDLARRVDSV